MIHVSTLTLLGHMLMRDMDDKLLLPSHWPYLQKTLNDIKDGWSPPLSKRCPEFLSALSTVFTFLGRLYVGSVPIELLHIY